MAQRQPLYRRPSWAQSDVSYKYYMRKDLAADRSPGQDYGLENFSYDEAHLVEWQLPEDLDKRLPPQLRDVVMDWEHAGAAVCTALERINQLDGESIQRAYPAKSSHCHLSRQGSRNSRAIETGDTPPVGSPISPTPMMPPSLLPLEKMSFEGLPRRRVIGMESPPFTPVDSHACPTPEIPHLDKDTVPPSSMPDYHALSQQYSPLSAGSRHSNTGTPGSPSPPAFDENAWETYLGTYQAELSDIRHHAWVRFKGAGYTVDRVRVELSQHPEYKPLLEDFGKWWAEMKPKMHAYEEKVKQLQAPSLEYVRMERMARGLSV